MIAPLSGRVPFTEFARFAVAVVLTGWVMPAVGADRLPGASSEDHLWFVAPLPAASAESETAAVGLYHHTASMSGPFYNGPVSLQREPDAMAAHGDRVWLVFPPRPNQEPPQRQVFTVAIQTYPGRDYFSFDPDNRLEVLPPMNGLGRLEGLIATPAGPVALLMPTQRAGSGVVASDRALAAAPALQQPLLLQFGTGAWRTIELPEAMASASSGMMVPGGADAETIIVLSPSESGSGRTLVHRRAPDGGWATSEVPFALSRLRKATVSNGQPLLALQADGPATVDLAYLRPPQLLALCSFEPPPGRWTVLGMRSGLQIISYSTDRPLRMRRVDAITGDRSDPQGMSPHKPQLLLHVPILLGLAIVVTILVFVIRPAGQTRTVTLPENTILMRLGNRLVALGIDLFPAAILAVLVTDCSIRQLTELPVWSVSLAESVPSMIMILIMLAHSTVTEIFTSRSLGKLFVDGRVIRLDGSRPGVFTSLVRNALKGFVLLIPPLAVVYLMNPNNQGLGDMLARTVVITEVQPPSEDE